MRSRLVASFSVLVASVALAGPVAAEKLTGYVWDVDPASKTIVVEGIAVRLGSSTRIERRNHPGILASDLRIGWEVEVRGEPSADGAWVAEKVKVKNERYEKIEIDGYVERIDGELVEVDGRRIRWPEGGPPAGLAEGARLEGKGVVLDDGAVRLEKVEIRPPGLDDGERSFMAMAASELEKLKQSLVPYEDLLFQEYVNRVGQSLVPDWVSREELRFHFSIVEDPDLNAFALPDGTIVIHTGLLAVLENEAQLAAVLGHEIAHVTHHHSYRGYRRRQKLQWLALGAAVAGAVIDARADRDPWEGPSLGRVLVEIGAALALTAAVNGHGRDLEDDADRIGLRYAVEAGYDPYQAPEVWRIFQRHVRDQNAVANWFFSDHSTHRARISNLTREINRHYRGRVDPSGLVRDEEEYARMVWRLRRHNAVLDYRRKEYRNAEAAFRGLLDARPDDPVAHLYLGKIWWDTGGRDRAEAALAAMERAAALDPTYAAPYREMGLVYYGLGDRRRAVASFERYLELDPSAPDAAAVRQALRDLAY